MSLFKVSKHRQLEQLAQVLPISTGGSTHLASASDNQKWLTSQNSIFQMDVGNWPYRPDLYITRPNPNKISTAYVLDNSIIPRTNCINANDAVLQPISYSVPRNTYATLRTYNK